MKKLGMYTGHIYEQDEPTKEECLSYISDEASTNEEYTRYLKTVNTVICRDCLACPEAIKEK